MKEDLCDWEENVIYIENSRTARAIFCDFVPEKKERKEKNQGIEKRKKESGGE